VVTNTSLARSYLVKSRARLKILPVLMAERAWSDVVREAQEIVELALKGMLRQAGVEPPHWHDVGGLVVEHRERFAGLSSDGADRPVPHGRRGARRPGRRVRRRRGPDGHPRALTQYTKKSAARASSAGHESVGGDGKNR
jgi:HEPN domain-containing protein